ncbi:hypothetical protein AX16_006494 [Volvariella volvacea WC 439]|nr:hypothetical protein AX16_006494 [Volvariella volvacea WC 439]
MTEYDYSEEALQRHLQKMNGISRWVSATEQGYALRDPYTPKTPSARDPLELRYIEEEGYLSGETGETYVEKKRDKYRERERESKRHRPKEKERDRDRDKEQTTRREKMDGRTREREAERTAAQEWYTSKPHRSKPHGYDSEPQPSSSRGHDYAYEERNREKEKPRKRDKEQARDREAERKARHVVQDGYRPSAYYNHHTHGASTYSLPHQASTTAVSRPSHTSTAYPIAQPDAVMQTRNSSKSAPPTVRHYTSSSQPLIPQQQPQAVVQAAPLLQAPPMLSSRSKSNPQPHSHQVLYPQLQQPIYASNAQPPVLQPTPSYNTTSSKSKTKASYYQHIAPAPVVPNAPNAPAAVSMPLHVAVPGAGAPIPSPIAPPVPAPLQQPTILPRRAGGGIQPAMGVSYHSNTGVQSPHAPYHPPAPVRGRSGGSGGGFGYGYEYGGMGGSTPPSGVTFVVCLFMVV